MLKELLAEEQPVVYRALKTAAEENRISSAYLFTGPAGTPKHEAAVLLAEEKDPRVIPQVFLPFTV